MTVRQYFCCDSFPVNGTNGDAVAPTGCCVPGGEDVVTHRARSWCGKMTRASSLAVITALIALPAAASDTPTKASTPTLKASMQHIVARDVAAKPAVTAARDRQTSSAGSSPGFFRSGPGM